MNDKTEMRATNLVEGKVVIAKLFEESMVLLTSNSAIASVICSSGDKDASSKVASTSRRLSVAACLDKASSSLPRELIVVLSQPVEIIKQANAHHLRRSNSWVRSSFAKK